MSGRPGTMSCSSAGNCERHVFSSARVADRIDNGHLGGLVMNAHVDVASRNTPRPLPKNIAIMNASRVRFNIINAHRSERRFSAI